MFEDSVLKTIKKFNMLENGDSVVVATSGGPDSMCLLNVLINLKEDFDLKISVAHVNHMIRNVADEETKYVTEFCKKNDIDCFVKKVDIIKLAESQKISTEEAGRNVRYDFFQEIYEKIGANKIAIAHNKKDNAETVLMNIMRGTGISGLKGIDPIRDNKFIRPLIEQSREDIEKYCEENNLEPKIDQSNFENIYTRNKIRNQLIPFIEENFNPNIVDSINRLSSLASQENLYIEKIVNLEYNNIILEKNDNFEKLNLKKFNLLDNFIQSKIILKIIQNLFGSTKSIEKIHIEDIIKMCNKNVGNKFLTPNKNTKVSIKSGVVLIERLNA